MGGERQREQESQKLQHGDGPPAKGGYGTGGMGRQMNRGMSPFAAVGRREPRHMRPSVIEPFQLCSEPRHRIVKEGPSLERKGRGCRVKQADRFGRALVLFQHDTQLTGGHGRLHLVK